MTSPPMRAVLGPPVLSDFRLKASFPAHQHYPLSFFFPPLPPPLHCMDEGGAKVQGNQKHFVASSQIRDGIRLVPFFFPFFFFSLFFPSYYCQCSGARGRLTELWHPGTELSASFPYLVSFPLPFPFCPLFSLPREKRGGLLPGCWKNFPPQKASDLPPARNPFFPFSPPFLSKLLSSWKRGGGRKPGMSPPQQHRFALSSRFSLFSLPPLF